MTPFDAYTQYLAFKNHFSKLKYDYHKYAGKSRASVKSFNERKDKYWFERISRQKSDDEIKNYYLANFVESDTPDRLWIGEIIRDGESKYQQWTKRNQSLSYIFKEQSKEMLSEHNLNELLDCSKQHPIILKRLLSGKICIETLVIWDKILLFGNKFDKKLLDPVWETVSLKIKKYSTFLNIDVCDYKQLLKQIISQG
jgi:hypothetical protein